MPFRLWTLGARWPRKPKQRTGLEGQMGMDDATVQASALLSAWAEEFGGPSELALGPRAKATLSGLHGRITRAYARASGMVSGKRPGVRRSAIPAARGRRPSGSRRFMPGLIGDYVHTRQLYQLMYSCSWGGKGSRYRARLRFAVYEHLELVDRTEFDRMATRALSWLIVCSEVSPGNCARELDIHLLRAPFVRSLPDSAATVLGPLHVNGGYATGCARLGEIVVYRVEEWFKVFVHETFHAFGLDAGAGASALNAVSKTLFPVDASHDVREAYTETWARVINAIYCAGMQVSGFLQRCTSLLDLERAVSLAQMSRVLSHMGTDIDCIQHKDAGAQCGYREATNVLSYYVLAGALMHDLNGFLGWCAVHARGFLYFQPGPRREASFAELLAHAVRSQSLSSDAERLQGWPGPADGVWARSTRMTALECWDGGTEN